MSSCASWAPFALACIALAIAPAARADDVREVVARVHASGEYGDRLRVAPSEDGPSVELGGADRGWSEAPRTPRAPTFPSAPEPLEVAAGGVSYLLLAIAIITVLVLLVLLVARTRGSAALAPAHRSRELAPVTTPVGGGRVALDDDPDALARQGRFADAIAAALLQGFAAVGWRPEGHAKSRTAREILASVPASDGRRVPLADLVRIEERVAFGGDEATEERWHEARARWTAIREEARA